METRAALFDVHQEAREGLSSALFTLSEAVVVPWHPPGSNVPGKFASPAYYEARTCSTNHVGLPYSSGNAVKGAI